MLSNSMSTTWTGMLSTAALPEDASRGVSSPSPSEEGDSTKVLRTEEFSVRTNDEL